jgi:hypothetical protein
MVLIMSWGSIESPTDRTSIGEIFHWEIENKENINVLKNMSLLFLCGEPWAF